MKYDKIKQKSYKIRMTSVQAIAIHQLEIIKSKNDKWNTVDKNKRKKSEKKHEQKR